MRSGAFRAIPAGAAAPGGDRQTMACIRRVPRVWSPAVLAAGSLWIAWLSISEGRSPPTENVADNEEIRRLFHEDQEDRRAADIDWAIVQPRDRRRQARVKELYTANRLRTGADYYHAAMVLQHADAGDDYLLAHEMCVVALSKGESRARWLAAATEDRFLWSIGRPQRFGTQFLAVGPGKAYQLYKIEPGVTDELRRAFGVRPLQEAKDRAGKIRTQIKERS